MIVVRDIFIDLAVIFLAFQVVTCVVVACRSLWRPKGDVRNLSQQGVTILRPVAGLENNLERTLRSAFELDHPKIEIIFCVAAADDAVIPLIRQLRAEYRAVASLLLIGDDPVSSNPKLNNLVKGWKAARYDWVVMADSNLLLPKNYIARLFARWKNNTGLVTSPPVGTEPGNFAAELEAAFLNTYQARWQLVSDTIGNGFAQGKTLFWRYDVLGQAGGIKALAAEMAEDAAATKIVRRQGLKVRLTAMPFALPLGARKFGAVWSRQIRWAKLRRDSFPLFFCLEILSGPLIPFGCMLAAALSGVTSFAVFISFVFVWYAMEILVALMVGWPACARQCAAMLVRDILLPAVWLSAFGRRGYSWKGHSIDMRRDRK